MNESHQSWLERSERFAKLVAENLRYGSWTKRFVTLGGVAFVVLNPISAGKVTENFGVRELPKWYVPTFWMGMGGLAIAAVGAAVVTLPKRTLEPMPERQAIKGLRSFELKDAEIFKRLERQRDVQECLDALDDRELRLFLLIGESGVGKSSLLQAGLMPNLGQVGCVYVKLGDRDPMSLIRKAVGVGEGEEFVAMLRSAVARAGQPIVLILDQFEQFFVQFREAERQGFITALRDWYESDVPVKLLIGIRGDLYDQFTVIQKALGYSLRPGQVHRLEKFAPEQATEVLRVMAETEQWSFNGAFVLEMARDELAGLDGKIAPVEVQVLAQMMSREPKEENRRFDRVAFQKLGGVDGLLGRSLQRSLDAIPGKSERERALEVLLALTDLERNVRSGAFSVRQLQGMTEKVHGSPSEVGEAVGWLSESRLITPGESGGEVVYELAHERLIPALRQVANQELSAASQANLLLERRVNEWLGSGKGRRYLFSLKELWLLRQQRGFLTWGVQRGQKQELLRRSWRQTGWNYGFVGLPVVLLLGFGGWSNTPPGQIQWTRWNTMIILNMGGGSSSFSTIRKSHDHDTALALDRVSGVKDNPFASLWLDLFTTEPSGASSLARIARFTSKIKNREIAKSLLRQVETVAKHSDKPTVKAQVLSEVSQGWVTLSEPQKAQQSLSYSLEGASSIEDESGKAHSLSSIAAAHNELGDREKGKQILAQALEVSNSIKDDSNKVSSLSAIAQVYGELGDREKGKQILAQALEVSNSIKDDSSKVSSLRSIAQVHSKLGSREKGKNLLEQSLEIANSIKKESSKVSSLGSIVQVASKLGDRETGKQILEQSLEIASSIKDESSKADSLISIAQSYVKLGNREKGKQLLTQALESADSITDEYDKVYFLKDIAETFRKQGDREKEQFLAKALEVIKSIDDESRKAYSLWSIAQVAGKLVDREKGKQILAQALEVADSMKEESNKVDSLGAVAQAYFELGERTQAKKLLDKVTRTIDTDQARVPGQSSDLALLIAQLHADFGNYGEALRLAQKGRSNERFAVFAYILQVHAEQQHPVLKALRDWQEEEE
jgi:tetratricopeptide (TPR) repeat protein